MEIINPTNASSFQPQNLCWPTKTPVKYLQTHQLPMSSPRKRTAPASSTPAAPSASKNKKRKIVKGKKRGGFLSALEGWWLVDKTLSDSPGEYLKFMGLPDIAVSAGVKAHDAHPTYISILIKSGGRIIVTERHSRLLNGRLDKFKVNETVTTELKKLGEKKMVVKSGEGGQLITESTIPTQVGRITVKDVRDVMDDDVDKMKQVVTCVNKKSGATLMRKVYYTRAPKPTLPLEF